MEGVEAMEWRAKWANGRLGGGWLSFPALSTEPLEAQKHLVGLPKHPPVPVTSWPGPRPVLLCVLHSPSHGAGYTAGAQ
jgi:hypothetical protein